MPPPVVASSKGVSLADHLNLRNMPLAATDGGRVFALKALHPSEHEIKSARVPGGNSLSVALCSDQVTTIPIPTAGTELEFNLIPNPLIPATLNMFDGTNTTYFQFMNAAIGGQVEKGIQRADYEPLLQRFADNVECYRITSQSATIELVAPSLSDQGTITACQYRCPPRTMNNSFVNLETTPQVMYCYPDTHLYENPVPVSKLVLGTMAYTSKAREGVYMPLKLTDFKWKHANDPVIPKSTHSETGVVNFFGIDASDNSGWPYYLQPGATSLLSVAPVPKCCGCNFGFIAMGGMAANVAVRIRVRQVIEITVRPSSTYAPLVEVSLPPDEMAMKMYFEISARMADAYPASYNDLGKLRSIVGGLAKKLSPFVDPALDILSKMPGIPGIIATGAKTVLPVIKGTVKQVRESRKKKLPSRI